jgi:hypothetical protein
MKTGDQPAPSAPAAAEWQVEQGGWRNKYVLWSAFLVFLAAVLVRLYRVGAPEFWGDEILFLRMCQPGLSVWAVIVDHLRSFGYIGHLPATAVLTNLGMQWQGVHTLGEITPFAARLPSLVLGCLSLPVLAWWVLRVTRRVECGLMALALGAFSFMHIWHSRDAYYYAGQLLFALLTLLFWTNLARRAEGRQLWRWAGYATSVVMLAFSHPAGLALLVPLSLVSLALAALFRQHWRWYLLMGAVGLVVCITLALMAGKPGGPGPWTDILRFPAWVVVTDLVDHFGFGPGNLRLVLSAAALLLGGWWLVRSKEPVALGLMALVPLVFLAIHVGGKTMAYAPKYFLLLWPFFTLLLATMLGRVVTLLQARFRWLALGLMSLLLAVNVVPGVAILYDLKGRWNYMGTLCRTLDEKLDAGTICLWDGGHATRFIPGFYSPQKPFTFGALPSQYVEAFVSRAVRNQLRNLRDAFPSVAYMEWGGISEPYEIRTAGGKAKQAQINKEIYELFPHHVVFDDPALRRLALTGWFPGVPRFADDYELRIECTLDHASIKLYYSLAADSGSLATPIFDPRSWQFLFSNNGQPLLFGAPRALVMLPKKVDPRVAGGTHVALRVVALQPGELEVLANGISFGASRLEQAGAISQFTTAWRGEPMQLEFRYRGAPGVYRPDYPGYAVIGVTIHPDAPKAGPAPVPAS